MLAREAGPGILAHFASVGLAPVRNELGLEKVKEAAKVGAAERADQLAAKLPGVMSDSEYASLREDTQHRIRAAVDSAARVLRRDDDGREAARHLQAALALLTPRPRRPSPFLDDE